MREWREWGHALVKATVLRGGGVSAGRKCAAVFNLPYSLSRYPSELERWLLHVRVVFEARCVVEGISGPSEHTD